MAKATKRTTKPAVSFRASGVEAALIRAIATRLVRARAGFEPKVDRVDVEMTITACHANGCPLDLERLLAAPAFDFTHDLCGIERHLDKNTGKLTGGFVPRYAKRKDRSRR